MFFYWIVVIATQFCKFTKITEYTLFKNGQVSLKNKRLVLKKQGAPQNFTLCVIITLKHL